MHFQIPTLTGNFLCNEQSATACAAPADDGGAGPGWGVPPRFRPHLCAVAGAGGLGRLHGAGETCWVPCFGCTAYKIICTYGRLPVTRGERGWCSRRMFVRMATAAVHSVVGMSLRMSYNKAQYLQRWGSRAPVIAHFCGNSRKHDADAQQAGGRACHGSGFALIQRTSLCTNHRRCSTWTPAAACPTASR